jgi:hypothetical protein
VSSHTHTHTTGTQLSVREHKTSHGGPTRGRDSKATWWSYVAAASSSSRAGAMVSRSHPARCRISSVLRNEAPMTMVLYLHGRGVWQRGAMEGGGRRAIKPGTAGSAAASKTHYGLAPHPSPTNVCLTRASCSSGKYG